MIPSTKNTTWMAWAAITALAISTVLMWLPALHVPFWGDDYVFLLQARTSHLSTAPWWSDFWPASPVKFWRPLSQEGYWRAMFACFHGSSTAMHAASLALHALASAGVGMLAFAVARACQWEQARLTAFFAGVTYATLAMHMLPVHWASAANNSMLTLFTALGLAAWISSLGARGICRILLLATIPAWQILALLTKESAVLTPLLMIVVGLFTGRSQWRRGNVLVFLACVAIIVAWLFLDARFTAGTDKVYTLTLGINTLRNGAAFVAWMLNVPREALRMALIGDAATALAWMIITALTMAAAWLVALWQGHRLLSPYQWLTAAAFAVLAYGPYFLFSWNSYAYYAAISAILPVITLAGLCTHAGKSWLVVLLVAVSSWVAVAGTRHVDRPGLIARANWGENLLQQLEKQPVGTPLRVVTSDDRRFYAVGKAGLAWRLGIAPHAIHLVRQCPAHARHCLVIEPDGGWHWRTPIRQSHR